MRFDSKDKATRDICSLLGDQEGRKYYVPVSRQLDRALEDLSFHFVPKIKSTVVVIGDNYSAQLPDDCLQVLKAGVICGDGYLSILGRRDKIYTTSNACTCGNSTDPTVKTECSSCTFHGLKLEGEYPWYISEYGEAYGLMQTNFPNGTWAYDEHSNAIDFGSGTDIVIGAGIVVEYKSDMADTLIPKIAYRMLEAKVMSVLSNDRAHWTRMFVAEVARYKRTKLDKYTLEDIINAFQENYVNVPR